MEVTLARIAELTGSTLNGDPNFVITGVAELASATPSDLSFFAVNPYLNVSFDGAMRRTQAGAVFIDSSQKTREGKQTLIHDNPSQAFQTIVELFCPPIDSAFTGVHETAVIHPTAQLGENVHIGPHVVIDQGAVIGSNTRIDSGSVVGAKARIGEDSHLYPRVTIREGCILGSRVIIQPGAVIGSCGFGYTTRADGKHTKIDQLGNVVLEDDVEIGANTTIDRGRFKSTKIGKGTKIDNLVQIAHNVQVGQDNLIVGQTGIAGSSKTGRNVVLAGQVAVNGHIELGDGVIIAARSGVIKGFKEAGKYVGEPCMPFGDYRRLWMHFMRLDRYSKRIKALEEKVSEQERAPQPAEQ